MLIPKDVDLWRLMIDSWNRFSEDFLSFECDQGVFRWRDAIR